MITWNDSFFNKSMSLNGSKYPSEEFPVGVAKLVSMVGLEFPCSGKLFRRHVDTHNASLRPDQLAGNVPVPHPKSKTAAPSRL